MQTFVRETEWIEKKPRPQMARTMRICQIIGPYTIKRQVPPQGRGFSIERDGKAIALRGRHADAVALVQELDARRVKRLAQRRARLITAKHR